ncbi:preprotein translocase subunit SecG [bacterium]|nr:preprotein translocase subunit SecG [bacterium]
MYTVLLALHILVCLGLVVTVLLQSGKGGGLAGAFGGGGGVGAVFGGQTAASFLTKATRYLAVIFMVSSLSMALIVRTRTPGTVEEGLKGMQPAPAAATGQPVPQRFEGGLPGSDEAATDELPSGEEIPVAPDGSGE